MAQVKSSLNSNGIVDDAEILIRQLHILGFKPNATNDTNYTINLNGYTISIDANLSNYRKSRIDYGSKIQVHHKGICNFEKPENLVQLECVIRLIKKGYKPKSIELEKPFPLGRRTKGRLDIYVTHANKCWAMIECKTPGEEYEKELRKVQATGGQIFSYFTQDRDAKVLVIYSSQVQDKPIFQSEQVLTNRLDSTGNAQTIHQSWDKSFLKTNLFDDGVSPYDLELKDRRKCDLIDLDRQSGRGLFNGFAEIIRKYVISDKANAFNVIFNLFVCKIFDEDSKTELDTLDFQFKSGDDSESLLARLSHLYRQSMAKYLTLELDERYHVSLSGGSKIALREFSFVDVINDETFEENANILKEVVVLLQSYRIKYSTKHQFLGEFFENLLHTSVKQESGQFFTPVPLARFMIRSLPINELIRSKISNKDPFILPYIIDFACGSGHFLTEAIDEVSEYFPSIDTNLLTGQAKRNFESARNNFIWARDYLYGIDKDHRLAKTTKIALFLNGDGDATILSADGLDDFYTSKKYLGRLRTTKPSSTVGTFDILVANPPFSVDGFVRTIPNVSHNFYLGNFATEKSTEIECLFVERMIQLLCEDGVAAIVLPLSILNNSRSIYTHARALLLLFCQIVALVELREKAMMATGTNLTILFVRKRKWFEVLNSLDELIKQLTNREDNAIPSEFSHIPENELQNLLSTVNAQYLLWQNHKKEEYTDISSFDMRIVHAVIKRLVKAGETVCAFSGEKKRQEFFLGYRFSRARGREGLTLLRNSLLYDKDNLENPNCVNFHISSCYSGNSSPITEDSELAKHLQYLPTSELLENDDSTLLLRPPSAFLGKKMIKIESISPHGDFINDWDCEEIAVDSLIKSGQLRCFSGVTYDKANDEVPFITAIGVLTASNIDINIGKIVLDPKLIYLRPDFPVNEDFKVSKWDIIMSNASGSLKHLGKVALAEKDYQQIIGAFISIIRCTDSKLAVALYFRLLSKEFRELMFTKKQQNINNFSVKNFVSLRLRLPKDLDLFFSYASRFTLII